MSKPNEWACGITTVPERRKDLLPKTVQSLYRAGFENFRLFVDGCSNPAAYNNHPFPATHRHPRMGITGNWILALWELYYRNPGCNRYAIFQDDVVFYRDLRPYLDHCQYPAKGYWNLYTALTNEPQTRDLLNDKTLQPPDVGWHKSDQLGRGALALVFDQDAVRALLGQDYILNRPVDSKAVKRKKVVDGAIATAMKNAKYEEYVHYPSLCQHIGHGKTTQPGPHRNWERAKTFKGADFNALNLLQVRTG